MPSKLLIISFVSLILLLISSCEKESTPFVPEDTVVGLRVESVGVTEAWLKVALGVKVKNQQLRLYRDGELLQKLSIARDTVLYDSTLLPAHSYHYRVELWKEDRLLGKSREITLTTMDTTSHDFEWAVYEFPSPFGSGALYDVAIIDENDIWAVGEIYSDSTNPALPYNAVHWDGEKWVLKRVNEKGSPINVILAFNENDIWFNGVLHWNGKRYELRKEDFPLLPNGDGWYMRKMWGTSSSNLYVVGDHGMIAHYDGERWHRLEISGMTGGSEFILTDIWGVHDQSTGEVIIYVTASSDPFDSSPIGRKILRIMGEHIDEVNVDGLPDYLTTIWFKDWRYYVGTLGGVYTSVGLMGQWDWVDTLSYYGIGRVRGNENNDVFVGGAFGLCAHYNGISWRIYTGRGLPWIYGTYTGLDVQGNKVVLVGDRDNDAIIVIGKR